ncbi:DUF429 domain-containing protein [Longimicrobium sp.]|uniref:DUF429 domain-containing protein n=1 Tax=Longimicrobium sp. TaxID=2029185 RepID=UPI002E330F0B|nr:DUF429 domain-containing protein [Longimicrobium sp.]HEX6040168.1 DUF429 domain-containing protein [Longimicrobium sp.]
MTFRYFGGIDFSGAKEPLNNLWTAVGEERDGRLCIVSVCPHPFRADLAAYVTGGWRRHARADDDAPVLWGADFPFGLPSEAVATIEGLRERSWRGVASWCADRPPDEVRDGLTAFGKAGRRTDTGGAMAPLDLRLYRQTVEGMRLLWEMRDGGEEVSILPVLPRTGAATTIVEVYPSGAVKDLGIKGSRVPSRAGEVRARPAAWRPYLSFDHPSLEAIACTLEDARDACIACLVAYQCRDDLDQPARAATVPADTVALEGWIYRPPAAVGQAG